MAVDPTLAAVAGTLRQVAEWGVRFAGGGADAARDELLYIAEQVEQHRPGAPCPLCQELECFAGCPLASF